MLQMTRKQEVYTDLVPILHSGKGKDCSNRGTQENILSAFSLDIDVHSIQNTVIIFITVKASHLPVASWGCLILDTLFSLNWCNTERTTKAHACSIFTVCDAEEQSAPIFV